MTETHSQDGSGFAHLGSLIPATVTIARGATRAVFSTGELEARLAVPGIAVKLAELLTAASAPAREPTESSNKGSLSPNANAEANAVQKIPNALAFPEEEDLLSSSRLVPPSTGVDSFASSERFAQYLAGALAGRDAVRNLAFYRLVARVVPRHIAQDALTRALDAQAVRKSRAHLFAFLIREHLPKHSRSYSPSHDPNV